LLDRFEGLNKRRRIIDGLAHYGLLPDLIQDLHNIGLGAAALTPMFRSAEDYIEMWEKTGAR
jgi:hypothetical protein